jgi:hypothetical protein
LFSYDKLSGHLPNAPCSPPPTQGPSTEKSYIFWLRRYIDALSRIPRNTSSEQKLERFLSNLAQDRDVSASTQNQAFNALLFFYTQVLGQTLGNVNALRAQGPVHERHAPTVAETQLLHGAVGNEGGYPTNPHFSPIKVDRAQK